MLRHCTSGVVLLVRCIERRRKAPSWVIDPVPAGTRSLWTSSPLGGKWNEFSFSEELNTQQEERMKFSSAGSKLVDPGCPAQTDPGSAGPITGEVSVADSLFGVHAALSW